ncbi:MAG: hypothetical protein QOJ35_4239 [Solirubrobacteraceae bacterium]|nr:hypothetical protein [Solirubrobacteraceae bacterium]
MRILIATQALVNPAGTETYVLVVARELQRLGHDVVVAAERLGPMAAHVEAQGIVVARGAAELPDACDAILANDAISATSFAARHPGVRLVQVAHSDLFDHQLPVLLPGVVDAVVVCSDRFAARVRALALDVPVVRLRLPVDADRFAGNGRLPARPRRAVIVSNYLTGERRRALVDAWEAQGVTCTQIGVLGEAVLDPSAAMRDADIVVGKSLAALEGMACGRAVYVYDQFGGDGWVTPESYPAFEADNMAGLSSATPRSPAQLAADLVDYDPDMGWINEELIRTHHASRRHAHELVDVLRAGRASPPVPTSVLTEITRLTRVAWGASQRTLSVEHELAALRERVLEAESQVAAREHVARESEQHLERAENAERELAAWTGRAENAERELAAWTGRAENAERELAAWTARARRAEAGAAGARSELAAWTARAQRAEAGAAGARSELAACRERGREAERQLAEAQRRLATARVRAGLAAGRAVDRLRRRR